MNGFAGRASGRRQDEQPEPRDEPWRTAVRVSDRAGAWLLDNRRERGLCEVSTVDLWPLDLWRWVMA